jgi:hypothetical protein
MIVFKGPLPWKIARIVGRSQLYAFLVLASLALQLSCGTHSSLQPPNPEQAHHGDAAESTGNRDTEATAAEQDRGKLPEASVGTVEKELLPESVLGFPEREMASPRVRYDTVVLGRASETGWHYRQNSQRQIVGFEFSNRGGNRILARRYEIEKNLLFTRDFQFRFDDRARQDIHLSISDWATSHDQQFKLSELMNSVMHFFPRDYLPAIISSGERTIVTLPTGETVEFDAKTHEIVAGAFSEAPVDLNPDKAARKFPGINYLGKGVVVRANSRGTDPRLGTIATITSGSPAPDCTKAAGCYQCQVPSKELWEQNGATRFKFSTDMEFDRYLLSRCGFGLPKRIVAIS